MNKTKGCLIANFATVPVQITLWREHTKILGNTGIEVLRVAKESLNDSQLVSRRLNQRIAIHGTMNT
ncbi:hypothetical protein HZ987_23990 (plasmid) [Escherichia coli]|uniref:hypothetical protein n=1 Tax=Escherichia coli TaxID=562 RepID=UPI0015D6E4D0|nr:hypothetical protein [Escherichia coli]QLJ38273.1 hypothetical protein HZ987_23990 [Escherichia coli]